MQDSGYRVVSLLGMIILMGFAWICSADRRKMNWRVIGWGVGLQLLFAVFIFRVPAGVSVFRFLNGAVVKVFDAVRVSGLEFVFGRLAVPPGEVNFLGEESISVLPILGCQAFPIIIFIAAVMSVLYFWRIMPAVIKAFAWVFTRFMRVSGAEALCVSSNVFVGVESALVVKPHVAKMTNSELCVMLTAGMATVASTVLAVYVQTLQGIFPEIAGHLISASILSAPAALVMSKIILPETEEPETFGIMVDVNYERESSVFEAVINGANTGLRLMFGIIALLIAVLGLLAVMDLVLGYTGGWVNGLLGWEGTWSMGNALGYVFWPFTVILGVPTEDVMHVSRLIGERAIATEVPAYINLAGLLRDGVITNPRSVIIATYALCGFAHVASLAIFVGGISAVAPSRAGDLSRVGVRALIAATLACLMTACVAGLFPVGETILFPK